MIRDGDLSTKFKRKEKLPTRAIRADVDLRIKSPSYPYFSFPHELSPLF